MKRLVLTVAAILLYYASVFPQFSLSQIGGARSTTILFGETPIENSAPSFNFRLFAEKNLRKFLSVRFQLGYGQMIYEGAVSKIRTTFLPMEVSAKYFPVDQGTLKPYFMLGTGIMGQTLIENQRGGFIPFLSTGAGFSAPFTDNLSLYLEGQFNYTMEDKFNGITGGLNDGIFEFRTGISYAWDFERKEVNKKSQLRRSNVIAVAPSHVTDRDDALELVELRSRIAMLLRRLQMLDSTLIVLRQELESKNRRIQSLELQMAEMRSWKTPPKQEKYPVLLARTTKSSFPGIDVNERYERALHKIDKRNYEEAILDLKELSQNFPHHPLYANFIYWIGECLFATQKYEDALSYFSQVKNISPNSKTDDAYFMTARCLRKLGDLRGAKIELQELLQKFPSSEYASLAKKLLDRLDRIVIS